MLLNDFFEITRQEFHTDRLLSEVKLQADHPIFKGHFPDHPIVPGVVQLQIVKELLENFFGKKIRLTGLKTCKFLKAINPHEHHTLRFEISVNIQDIIYVNVKGWVAEESFLKANLDYIDLHL